MTASIPAEYAGWWRIIEMATWRGVDPDVLGPALLSLTGRGDRLRFFVLLAHVEARPSRTGVSFTWRGAWEYDQLSGDGSVKVGKDGRLHGRFKIERGDKSTFIAERAEPPEDPIPEPPSYRDKWRRR